MRAQPRPSDARWSRVLGLPSRVFSPVLAHALQAEIAPKWREDAACASADPDAWFPPLGSQASATVLRVCDSCPVRRSCLAHALVVQEDGVWAGTSPNDRATLTDLIVSGADVGRVLEDFFAHGHDERGRDAGRAA